MKYFRFFSKYFWIFLVLNGKEYQLFNNYKLFCRVSKVVDAVFGNSNHILNSASVLTEEINSGLYREYFTYFELSAKATGI